MKRQIIFIGILIYLALGCKDSKWNGEWGATVGNCDELCTIYYSAQQELLKDLGLQDKDFPNQEQRRKHVTKTENGHNIKSWFQLINDTDTTIKKFSCEVVYDTEKIGYVIKNMIIEEPNYINKFYKESKNSIVYNPSFALWAYEFDESTNDFKIIKSRKVDNDTLTPLVIENIINMTWPRIRIKYLNVSNDTLLLSIPDSEVLTQQMGTFGADQFMISTTYSSQN